MVDRHVWRGRQTRAIHGHAWENQLAAAYQNGPNYFADYVREMRSDLSRERGSDVNSPKLKHGAHLTEAPRLRCAYPSLRTREWQVLQAGEGCSVPEGLR